MSTEKSVKAAATALAMGGGSISATAAILVAGKYGVTDPLQVSAIAGLFASIGHGLVSLVHKIGGKK